MDESQQGGLTKAAAAPNADSRACVGRAERLGSALLWVLSVRAVGDDEGWKKPLSSGACHRLAAGPPSAPSPNFLDARHHDGAGRRWRAPRRGAFARAKLIAEVIVAVEPVLVVRGLALLLGGAPDLRLDFVDIDDRRRPPFVCTTAWQSLTLRSSGLGLR
jgi:hypothetical protein